MSNSDDPKFDDFQIPDEGSDQEQPDFELDDLLNTDDDSTYISLDEPSEMNMLVDGPESSLDLPDETQLGENTSPFADELELFGELNAESFNTKELPATEQVSEPLAETPEVTEDTVNEDFTADLEPVAMADEDSFHFFDDLNGGVTTEALETTSVTENVEITEDVEAIGDFFDDVEEPSESTDFSEEDLLTDESEILVAEIPEELPAVTEVMDEPVELANLGEDGIEVNGFDGLPLEDAAVADDKKSKKAKKEKPPKVKKEKPPKKEKAPKIKKEKKRKEPGEKQPLNVAALSFMAGFGLMIAVFAGVNLYAVMKHGAGAMVFLAIFDLLALGALAIPFLLRRSKNSVTPADVTLGIAAVSLIFGCMFLLANLAFNLGG